MLRFYLQLAGVIFIIGSLIYMGYLIGYSEGQKDSKKGIDKHPPDRSR